MHNHAFKNVIMQSFNQQLQVIMGNPPFVQYGGYFDALNNQRGFDPWLDAVASVIETIPNGQQHNIDNLVGAMIAALSAEYLAQSGIQLTDQRVSESYQWVLQNCPNILNAVGSAPVQQTTYQAPQNRYGASHHPHHTAPSYNYHQHPAPGGGIQSSAMTTQAGNPNMNKSNLMPTQRQTESNVYTPPQTAKPQVEATPKVESLPAPPFTVINDGISSGACGISVSVAKMFEDTKSKPSAVLVEYILAIPTVIRSSDKDKVDEHITNIIKAITSGVSSGDIDNVFTKLESLHVENIQDFILWLDQRLTRYTKKLIKCVIGDQSPNFDKLTSIRSSVAGVCQLLAKNQDGHLVDNSNTWLIKQLLTYLEDIPKLLQGEEVAVGDSVYHNTKLGVNFPCLVLPYCTEINGITEKTIYVHDQDNGFGRIKTTLDMLYADRTITSPCVAVMDKLGNRYFVWRRGTAYGVSGSYVVEDAFLF